MAGGKPPIPTGETSITSRDFTANWRAVENSDPPSRYEIQVGTSSLDWSNPTRETTVSASARSYRFTGLSRGAVYYWRIRSYHPTAITTDGNAYSPWSPPQSIDLPSGIPGVPGSAINGVASDAINFTWTAPSGNGESISGYQVQRANNSSFTSGVVTVSPSASARSYRFGGLKFATTYYFRVRAKTEAGYGGWSTVRSATTDPVVPSAPRNFVVNPRDYGTAAGVGWSAPSTDGGRSITEYVVIRWNSTGNTALQYYNYSASTRNALIEGLTPGATYHWTVQARNSVGASATSTKLKRTQPGPPGPPNFSRLTVIDGDTAEIVFSAPSDDGGASITGYEIVRATNSGFTSGVVRTNVTSPGTHRVEGLSVGTRYYWFVRAKNAVTSPLGDRSVVRNALQDNIPLAPVITSATPSATGVLIDLKWEQPRENGASTPSKYTIYRYNAAGTTVEQTYTSSTLSARIEGLIAGRTYQWAVSATNPMGTSARSSRVTRKQPSTTIEIGDYFDGSTAPNGEMTYEWLGTPHESRSVAYARRPLGWGLFAFGTADSGGTGTLISSTGNPRFRSRSAHVTFWSPTTAPGYRFMVGYVDNTPGAVPEDADLVASIYIWSSRPQLVQVGAMFFAQGDTEVLDEQYGEPVEIPAEEWVRVSGQVHSPRGANLSVLSLRDTAGEDGTDERWSRWEATDEVFLDGAMLTAGTTLFPYFDGSFEDNRTYKYSWTGEPDNSTSRRDTVVWEEPQEDPLQDPDCPPFPSPPRPPSIDVSCADQVDRWRRYWVSIPSAEVAEFATTLPLFALFTESQAVNQVRIRIYENPSEMNPEVAELGPMVSEQIISYVPPHTAMTLDSMTRRAYAEVDGASAVPADHLVFGSGGPPTYPELRCGGAYAVAFDVPAEIPVGAVRLTVRLTKKFR